MSTDVLVCRAKEAAQSANWPLLNRYLHQLTSNNPSLDALNIALYGLQIGDFQARWGIAKVIPQFGVQAIAPLIALLEDVQDDEDWELVWFIARILGEYPCPDAIAALRNVLLRIDQSDIISVAIDALASIGEAAIDTLADLIHEPPTRLSAVQALAKIRHPSATDILLTVAEDEDAQVRSVAIASLGYIRDPRVTSVLLNAARDVAASVRHAAIIGLTLHTSLIPEATLLGAIEPLLWDLNLDVRRQALFALSRLQSAAAATHLYAALCSDYTPLLLKPDALRALIWTATPEALQYLDTLVTANLDSLQASHSNAANREAPVPCVRDFNTFSTPSLPAFPLSSVWYELAATLGLLEHDDLKPQATALLIKILHLMSKYPGTVSNEVAVKQAIAHSLGQLGQPESIEALVGLLIDQDKRIQLHTIGALKKLLGMTGADYLRQVMEEGDRSPALQQGIAQAIHLW